MKEKTHKITDLLSLTVFALFALCVLAVLLTGGNVYRNLVRSGGETYADRTAVSYIATRVRQAQAVTVEDFGGCDALVIREEANGKTYLTRIYCHDGYLRELYAAQASQLQPGDGEKILEAEAFSVSLADGLLTAVIDGNTLTLQLRSGREVRP